MDMNKTKLVVDLGISLPECFCFRNRVPQMNLITSGVFFMFFFFSFFVPPGPESRGCERHLVPPEAVASPTSDVTTPTAPPAHTK